MVSYQSVSHNTVIFTERFVHVYTLCQNRYRRFRIHLMRKYPPRIIFASCKFLDDSGPIVTFSVAVHDDPICLHFFSPTPQCRFRVSQISLHLRDR